MTEDDADIAPGEHTPSRREGGKPPASEAGGRAHTDTNPGVNADLSEDSAADTEAHPLLAAYRHDVHKLRGRRHEAASETFTGVRVNETVPLGADADAALLSRPPLDADPEYTVSNHTSWQRLSLVNGEAGPNVPVDAPGTPEAFEAALRELVRIDDPEAMHRAWLVSDITATVTETPLFPFTSLKFHTLLVGALLDTYRAGYDFDDLYLVVDSVPGAAGDTAPATRQDPGSDVTAEARGVGETVDAAPRVVPHRTVFWDPLFALRITATPGDSPAARFGDAPARSFADTWSRLPAHPRGIGANTEGNTGTCGRGGMLLDAQLRRIRSWSAALQYVEDFLAWFRAVDEAAGVNRGGDG